MELEGTDFVLIQTVDFITPLCDDTYWFGRVAAANALSDVYAMGGRPLSALNICCFPTSGPSPAQYAEILRGGLDVLNEAGAVLLGGQTVKNDEIKYGLSVTGTAQKSQLTPNSGAREGDQLILTKPIGTGILIGAYRSGKIDEAVFMPAVEVMAELNRTAALAMVEAGAQGATDITGFGLSGHAWEMAKASNVRLVIEAHRVPVYESALKIASQNTSAVEGAAERNWTFGSIVCSEDVSLDRQHLLADPQTSGGLLIAVADEAAEALLLTLHDRGVKDATIIGIVEASPDPAVQILP